MADIWNKRGDRTRYPTDVRKIRQYDKQLYANNFVQQLKFFGQNMAISIKEIKFIKKKKKKMSPQSQIVSLVNSIKGLRKNSTAGHQPQLLGPLSLPLYSKVQISGKKFYQHNLGHVDTLKKIKSSIASRGEEQGSSIILTRAQGLSLRTEHGPREKGSHPRQSPQSTCGTYWSQPEKHSPLPLAIRSLREKSHSPVPSTHIVLPSGSPRKPVPATMRFKVQQRRI